MQDFQLKKYKGKMGSFDSRGFFLINSYVRSIRILISRKWNEWEKNFTNNPLKMKNEG